MSRVVPLRLVAISTGTCGPTRLGGTGLGIRSAGEQCNPGLPRAVVWAHGDVPVKRVLSLDRAAQLSRLRPVRFVWCPFGPGGVVVCNGSALSHPGLQSGTVGFFTSRTLFQVSRWTTMLLLDLERTTALGTMAVRGPANPASIDMFFGVASSRIEFCGSLGENDISFCIVSNILVARMTAWQLLVEQGGSVWLGKGAPQRWFRHSDGFVTRPTNSIRCVIS